MYINSNNIVVYPTLKRNNNNIETSSIISEQGITSLINRLTENKSYVIDGLQLNGDGTALSAGSCNICGYKFTISEEQPLTPLENSKYLYLKMNCTEATSKSNISPLSLKGFDILTRETKYNIDNLQYSGLDIIFTNSILNDKNNAKYLLIAEKRESQWVDYTQFAPIKTNLIKTNLYGFDDGELYEGTKINFYLNKSTSINITFIPVENCVVNFGNRYVNVKGTNTTITITNEYKDIGNKTITINGYIKLYGKILKENNNIIESLQLAKNVINIGENSFANCSSLTKITISNNVTTIDSGAFSDCSNLTSVYYAGTIENWCNIAFSDYYSNPMSKASHFYIKNSNGEYEELTEVEIPNTINTINRYTFCGFKNITKVIIPNSVTNIEYRTFAFCTNLTKVIMGNSVINILSYVFEECSSLTDIIIPNSVINIGDSAFSGCSRLTSITIPNSVTNIGSYAFYRCSSLTKVIIPNSIKWIKYATFANCNNLKKIYYQGTSKEWSNISINDDSLASKTIYYYSATQPTESGNYWHYDTDGTTILEW